MDRPLLPPPPPTPRSDYLAGIDPLLWLYVVCLTFQVNMMSCSVLLSCICPRFHRECATKTFKIFFVLFGEYAVDFRLLLSRRYVAELSGKSDVSYRAFLFGDSRAVLTHDTEGYVSVTSWSSTDSN